jgi:hypothetical protein
MGKSAIRLLALAICSAAFVVVPTITPVKAATNDNGEVEKNKKKIQKGTAINDPRSSSPAWPPPMYDDFDRKNTGGGM